ncbi:aldehyde dehydrogenase [Rhodococcus sp. NPDC019627]|uniref:aldehyde dehydrogenase n=1 Tax=unclassified Rhodococcus (in: high G+C Gram-positive bacteria) TaxID=192944 RepID=UPI0033E75461
MQQHTDVFIAGRWVPSHSGASIDVVNPTTEEIWASVPGGDEQDIDKAVTAARDTLPSWAARSPSERAEFLRRLADEIDRRAAELTRVITTENGTPIAESSAAPAHSAAHLRLTAGLADLLTEPDVRPNPMAPGSSVVHRRPVGVAGLITPWNFPLGLVVIKLGPALLAGCTVVIKPAPETPMATRLLMDAVDAAGIPAGVVNLVTGGTRAGTALVEHPGVDKISFTGSTEVGRAIGASCGRRLRPMTLELGGKSPAIVLDDVDPELLAHTILKVSMRNTGQTCKACTRLLVPATRHDELVDLVGDVVSAAPIGDPFDPGTFFGPVVSARQRERVLDYLDLAQRQGAKAVTGGGPATRFDRGYYVEPTVFRDVTPDMRIAREEVFGPVLAIVPYRDLDEAVAIANDSPYGLAATVLGEDLDRAMAVAERLETGNVGINHYGSNAAAPFGGHKDSGLGTEFGPEGLAAYLQYTSIHRQF